MVGKSLYSLILMDEVIDKIDKIAKIKGMNRSSLINQILAESVEYVTPQKRNKNVFELIEESIKNEFLVGLYDDTTFCAKSSIRYKYSPVVNYAVDIITKDFDTYIKIKVYFRTQNSTLISYIENFFILLAYIEKKYNVNNNDVEYIIDSIKFTKVEKIKKENNMFNESKMAEDISNYVRLLDKMLNLYFDNIYDIEFAKQIIENEYLNYINNKD